MKCDENNVIGVINQHFITILIHELNVVWYPIDLYYIGIVNKGMVIQILQYSNMQSILSFITSLFILTINFPLFHVLLISFVFKL